MKSLATFATIFLTACSSVQMMDGSDGVNVSGSCAVRVFMTKGAAEKVGPIDELCIINGSSSGSFSHTVATAIEKHKGKACGCGATNVYVESRRESTLDVATVTLVAFRFVTPAK